MSEKLKVGILGGTGMVGQRFISLLENHPWFEVTTIAASPRSAGKTYEQAVGDRWKMDTPMPEAVKNIIVMNVNEVEQVASQVDFVFSAVDMTKDEIKKIEEDYAKTETPVVSNNSAHRWTPDVPMVVPEINPQHMEVIKYQKERLGTKRGFVAVKPNCSIQSYAPVLTAWKEFEPYEVVATTYQAISGAVDIDVSDEKLIARLSGRRVCPACGGTYHISRLNGRTDCERCGAALIQRDDDKAETVLSRLNVYHKQTAPLIEFYEQRGLLRRVDGAQPMEDCFEAILKALGETK